MEEILKTNTDKYTIFPIKYANLWKLYEEHVASFWTAGDIDFKADDKDWESLDEPEKIFILNILAFFAGSDGIVLENLMGNFGKEVQISEARSFYSIQGAIETIHGEVYSRLIEAYARSEKEKNDLFKAIENMPIVAKKSNWATEFMDPETKNFAQRLVAFAVVEGIFFSGSFCAIYWLKSKNKMVQTLGTSNELIARDEALHTRFAIELYKLLRNKLTQDEIERIVRPAVAIEVEFICKSIRCPMIGMNETMMSQYIKFCADRLLLQLGYKKIYNTKNPFPFMDAVGLGGKTNFFEKRTTEYQLASAVSGKITYEVSTDF